MPPLTPHLSEVSPPSPLKWKGKNNVKCKTQGEGAVKHLSKRQPVSSPLVTGEEGGLVSVTCLLETSSLSVSLLSITRAVLNASGTGASL